MAPGFAKIDNELFSRADTMMLFGDANQTLTALVKGLKKKRREEKRREEKRREEKRREEKRRKTEY